MKPVETVCAVILTEEGYGALGDTIKPYVKDGSLGRYMYCMSATQSGNFVDMKFHPSQCDGSIKDIMIVSVPVQFVKLMISGGSANPLGFSVGSK